MWMDSWISLKDIHNQQINLFIKDLSTGYIHEIHKDMCITKVRFP